MIWKCADGQVHLGKEIMPDSLTEAWHLGRDEDRRVHLKLSSRTQTRGAFKIARNWRKSIPVVDLGVLRQNQHPFP